MSTIQELFQKAQLSEASYANFLDSAGILLTSPDDIKAALRDRNNGMTFPADQAAVLMSQWRVVDQYTAPFTAGILGTGFSATLFQNIETGRYTFGIRGTNDVVADLLVADVGDIVLDGIAMDQVVDMYNYWVSLNSSGTYKAARLETMVVETAQLRLLSSLRLTGGAAAATAYDAYVASLKGSGAILDTTITGLSVRRVVTGDSDQLLAGTALAQGRGLIHQTIQLDVVGHSLGGHLAAAFTRLFPLVPAEAVTVNGAGFPTGVTPGLGRNALSNIKNLFAKLGGAANFDPATILNVHGSGPNLVTMNSKYGLVQQGGTEEVFIENPMSILSDAAGHGVSLVTDSLAVYDLFAELDPQLRTAPLPDVHAALNPMFEAASARFSNSHERLVDGLVKVFDLDLPSLSNDNNRDELFKRIVLLRESIAEFTEGYPEARVDVLVDAMSAEDLAALAHGPDALAYRFALRELNPFAIVGSEDLYARHNLGGELDLYNNGTGDGTLTDSYLADRSEMLSWKNAFNQGDGTKTLRVDSVETRQFIDKTIKDDITGNDLTFTVAGRQESAANTPSKVIFGGDQAEFLIGSDIAAGDRIYGDRGDDTLQGNQGNDYLEGGSGNDTYVWNAGDGFDTILDTDGQGKLVIDGSVVSGGIQIASHDYISLDKKFLFHLEEDTDGGDVLLVNGDLRIDGFANGDLGINLENVGGIEQVQPTANVFLWPYSDISRGVGFGTDGDDLVFGGEAAIAEISVFSAKGGDDLLRVASDQYAEFYAGPGKDVILGGGATQIGTGSVLFGEAGSDIILGGDDNETIQGDFGLVSFGSEGFALPSFSFSVVPLEFGETTSRGYWRTWLTSYLEVDVNETLLEPFHGTFQEAFRYALGIGSDTNLSTLYDDYIQGGGGNDKIFGDNGSDILIGGDGNDVIVGDGLVVSGPGLSQQWSAELVSLLGAPGDDYLDGGPGNDVLEDGASGNGGSGGNDVLIGGEGNDILTNVDPASESESFANYLDGGGGDDVLQSTNVSIDGFDTLIGGPGNDTLTITARSNAELDGGSGDDAFTVGALSNIDIDGGTGSDTYSVTFLDPAFVQSFAELLPGITPGSIAISESDAAGSDFDSLSLSLQSFGPSSVLITRDESNLYFGAQSLPHWLTVENWFEGVGHKIEAISISSTDFSSPNPPALQVYDVAAIESLFTTATVADDTLWGSDATDQLAGDLGSDTLFGGGGDDALTGGKGDDTLDGGKGADVYVFGLGDGVDRIADSGTAGSDGISFGSGITADMLVLDPDSLTITVGQDGDAIQVGEAGSSDGAGFSTIEYLQFSDGSTLSFQSFLSQTLNPGDDADVVGGGSVGDPTGEFPGDTVTGNSGGPAPGDGAPADSVNVENGAESSGSATGAGEGGASSAVEVAAFGNSVADPIFTWWPEQDSQKGQSESVGGSARDTQSTQDVSRRNPRNDPWYASGQILSEDARGGSSYRQDSGLGNRALQPRHDDMQDLLDAYFADESRFNVAHVDGWGRLGSHREAVLTSTEVAQRWKQIDRYMNMLADKGDEDARAGAGEYRIFDDWNFVASGDSGGAFGFAGATGATRGYANLKTLSGLAEGFQLLRG